jgi:hypothetical protein
MKPKLLVITDLGLLKAFRIEHTPKGTPRLELVEEVLLEDAHQKLTDKLTDQGGRNTGSANRGGTTTMADTHNLQLEYRRRLVRQLASKIETIVSSHGKDGCWLAAPKEINHLITEELPRSSRERIEVNLARDLTKIEPSRLLEHFPSTLPVAAGA